MRDARGAGGVVELVDRREQDRWEAQAPLLRARETGPPNASERPIERGDLGRSRPTVVPDRAASPGSDPART